MKTRTVKQLIEQLKTQPQDAEVEIAFHSIEEGAQSRAIDRISCYIGIVRIWAKDDE